MNKNPKWWNPEHESRWERVKTALKRDWDQTRHDFGGNEPDTDQDVGDTVKQAAGKQPVPPRGMPADDESAYRFGYGARHQYERYPVWNSEVESQLESDWKETYSDRDWARDRQAVRFGWDYEQTQAQRKAA